MLVSRSPSRPSIASIACVAVLVMNSIAQATWTPKQQWSSIRYSTVAGFFAQDLPETDETTFDYVCDDCTFGIIYNKLMLYYRSQAILGSWLNFNCKPMWRKDLQLMQRHQNGGNSMKPSES